MILHGTHIAPRGSEAVLLAERGAEVMRALLGLVAGAAIEPRLVPSLRVHLDWIQYLSNFREPVLVRRAADRSGGPLALAEVAVDLRRVEPAALDAALLRALAGVGADAADGPAEGPPAARSVDTDPRQRHLALQSTVLAASRRLGGGVGPPVRGGPAERALGREPARGGHGRRRRLLDAPARPREKGSA